MRTAPIINSVWISRTIGCKLKELADEYFPLEVGGILAGYLSDESAVVTEIVGPGPQAQHHRETFLPDHRYQTEQMHRIFLESKGGIVYLGDWHTHPHGPPVLSPLDIRTMRAIAESPEARCPSPVMILLARVKTEWMIRAFCLANPREPLPEVRAVRIQLL